MGEEMHVVTYLTGILPETGAFLKVSQEKQTSLPSAIDHSLTHRSRCYKHTAQCANWKRSVQTIKTLNLDVDGTAGAKT